MVSYKKVQSLLYRETVQNANIYCKFSIKPPPHLEPWKGMWGHGFVWRGHARSRKYARSEVTISLYIVRGQKKISEVTKNQHKKGEVKILFHSLGQMFLARSHKLWRGLRSMEPPSRASPWLILHQSKKWMGGGEGRKVNTTSRPSDPVDYEIFTREASQNFLTKLSNF